MCCEAKKIASALKEQKIRTKVNEAKFTTFDFNKKATAVGDDPCNALALTFSNRTRTRDWTYKSDDKMYHSTDYETDVKMKNLIVLFDNTSYTTKANYKGSGKGRDLLQLRSGRRQGCVGFSGHLHRDQVEQKGRQAVPDHYRWSALKTEPRSQLDRLRLCQQRR